MAVTISSHTGTRWTMMETILSSWEIVCTLTSVVAGEELTVTCLFQERCATFLHRVSSIPPSFHFSFPLPSRLISSMHHTHVYKQCLLPSSWTLSPPFFFFLFIESIAFSSDVVCQETWVKFRGSCYNFEPIYLRMPLEEAREHCRKKGPY